MSEYIQHNQTVMAFNNDESWVILSPIELSIKRKIEAIGVPLKEWNLKIYRGIITGYNEAFIISGEKKDELIAADPKSAEIIRPILRGRDIKRYSYKFADLWVILAGFGSYKYLENDYPAVYKHLLTYKEKLAQRGQCRYTSSGKINSNKEYPGQHHWLELDNNPSKEYLDDFSKQKIVYREISDEMNACIVESGICLNNKCYFITGEYLEYLLCIFNSKLFNKIILNEANLTGGKGAGFLNDVKLPKPTEKQNSLFKNLYHKIVEAGSNEISDIEEEIDYEIYSIYGLSNEEILIIDP